MIFTSDIHRQSLLQSPEKINGKNKKNKKHDRGYVSVKQKEIRLHGVNDNIDIIVLIIALIMWVILIQITVIN